MVKTILFSILLAFFGCKEQNQEVQKYSSDGEFAYYVQLGHFDEGQVKSMGPCTRESFLKEFEEFDWENQLLVANKKGKVSPTLAVRHNKSALEMRISVAGPDVANSTYWVFYGEEDTTNHLVFLDRTGPRSLLEKFFELDFEHLNDGYME